MIGGHYDERETGALAVVAKMGEKPFPAETEARAIQVAGEALNATKRVRQRNPDGDIIYVDIPDWPIRAAMAIKVVEHNLGKPLQRTINANLNANQPGESKNVAEDLFKLLLATPDTAADIVLKLKEAAEKAQRSKPIEITAAPTLTAQPPKGS